MSEDTENINPNRESKLYRKKWTTNYAHNGLSLCKDLHCLYGDKKIPKGSLRIGRRYPSPFDPDSIAVNWFHAKCMFNQQARSRVGTQIIGSIDDIDGVDDILLADRDFIEELIQGNVELVATDKQEVEVTRDVTTVRAASSIKKPKKAAKSDGPANGGRRVSINKRDAGRVLLL